MDRIIVGLLLSVFGCVLLCTGTDGADKARVATCLDKFAAVANHTLCLANRTQFPLTDADRDAIVNAHNAIRESVDPPAANMLKMYYSKELEEEAQIWAEHCVYMHEPDRRQRNFPGEMTVGQNIAMSSTQRTWARITALWEADKTKYAFKYGAANMSSSHYTQQIWSSTTLIGCGLAHCAHQGYVYVCNYGPGGNSRDSHHHIVPYKQATSGHGGSDCPSKHGKNSTLCDCNGAVCKNKGVINPDTCSCTCSNGPKYSDAMCSLSCESNSDLHMCGHGSFVEASCTKYSNVPTDCPWMCHTCPFAGSNYVEGSSRLPGETNSPIVG